MISNTGYLILGLLLEEPLSGYMIRKLTLLRYKFFWSESFGQIYPQLKRLSSAGLIRAAEGPATGKREIRYSLTQEGGAALRSWLDCEDSSDQLRLESVLKIYTAAVQGGDSCAANLDRFAERSKSALADLRAMRAELRKAPDPLGNHQRIISLMDLGIATYRAWSDWATKSEILKEPGI